MNSTPRNASRLSGQLMVAAMVVALFMANTRFSEFYHVLHHTVAGVHIGGFSYEKPIYLWINEGLLVLFFLKIGLETKRELLTGALSASRVWRLPLLAALGGMAVPALIYIAFNFGDGQALSGWAVPAATDAVLAIGILSLFSSRKVTPLVAFLTVIAVFDDIGAIAIIGLFYGETFNHSAAVMALALTGVLFALGAFRLKSLTPYFVVTGFLWAALLASGLHATLAGVALGFAIPLHGKEEEHGPLDRLVRDISPIVMFAIVPAFAFFNSGILLSGDVLRALSAPVSLGIVTGLVVGKPIGIAGTAYLAEKLSFAELPKELRWSDVCAASIFGGIGFTMSIFIASVAFPSMEQLNVARLSVLSASLLASLLGVIFLMARQRFQIK